MLFPSVRATHLHWSLQERGSNLKLHKLPPSICLPSLSSTFYSSSSATAITLKSSKVRRQSPTASCAFSTLISCCIQAADKLYALNLFFPRRSPQKQAYFSIAQCHIR